MHVAVILKLKFVCEGHLSAAMVASMFGKSYFFLGTEVTSILNVILKEVMQDMTQVMRIHQARIYSP